MTTATAPTRLGSWQREILDMARTDGTVAWSQVQPRGAARRYAGQYHRRFLALSSVPGYQIGAYGPRGGLALRHAG